MVETIKKRMVSVHAKQTIRLSLTDHLPYLDRWSVLLFHNLCILNIVYRLYRGIR